MPEKVAYIKDYRMDGIEIHGEIEPFGGGYVKLFRKLTEWEWYADSQSVHLFIHILLHVNHKTRKWQGLTVHRGEMITSIAKLSEATGIAAKPLRTRLKKFEKSGEISLKTANRFTRITVCNYDIFQGGNDTEGQTKGKQRANKGQTKGNKQECKECKEDIYTPNSGEFDPPTEEPKTKPGNQKGSYGEGGLCKLTTDEYAKLVDKFGEQNTEDLIFRLSTYIGSKGRKYKSHYMTILSWAKKDGISKPTPDHDSDLKARFKHASKLINEGKI